MDLKNCLSFYRIKSQNSLKLNSLIFYLDTAVKIIKILVMCFLINSLTWEQQNPGPRPRGYCNQIFIPHRCLINGLGGTR